MLLTSWGCSAAAVVLAVTFLSEWMLDHEYFHYGVITQGLLVGVHWDVAEESEP